MSATCVRNTSCVTETQWERLYRLIQRRRKILGFTLEGIQAIGGPSPRWIQKLKSMEGVPSDRMRRPMRNLDSALNWPQDTAWGLVTDDRSSWSDVILQDEEESLMERVDEAEQFAFVVAARLRAVPEGARRDELMRRILEVLDVHA